MRYLRAGGCSVLVTVAALVLGADVHAAQRFAQPGAAGPEPCARIDPCSLEDAAVGHDPGDVQSGDVIRLLPGTHSLPGGIAPPGGITLRADDPEDVPIVTTPFFIDLSGNSRIQDIRIHQISAPSALILRDSATAERVWVESTSGVACRMAEAYDVMLRNSVCLYTGTGLGAAVQADSVGANVRVINVTALATWGDFGAAIKSVVDVPSGEVRIEVVNSIAKGASDAVAIVDGPITATSEITFRNSNVNFANTQTFDGGSIVDGGGNQGDFPLFVNPLSDFRPVPASPTRDAGDSSARVGGKDLAGMARVQGKRVDIGAYEFDAAPQTRITRKPKRVLRVIDGIGLATFRFTSELMSTFECRLRGGKRPQRRWRTCDSPQAYSVRAKKRKYVFQVRATDASGNRDKTPAKAAFKVRAR